MKNRQTAFGLSPSRQRVGWVAGNHQSTSLPAAKKMPEGYEKYPIDMRLAADICILSAFQFSDGAGPAKTPCAILLSLKMQRPRIAAGHVVFAFGFDHT
jgi:hypothetical protein